MEEWNDGYPISNNTHMNMAGCDCALMRNSAERFLEYLLEVPKIGHLTDSCSFSTADASSSLTQSPDTCGVEYIA